MDLRTVCGGFANSVWLITYRAAGNNGSCCLQQVFGRGEGVESVRPRGILEWGGLNRGGGGGCGEERPCEE